jgi:hypothetical protein
MRLVTFANKSGEERLGALFDSDSQASDLADAHRIKTGKIAPELASMQAVIEGGPDALDVARALEYSRSSGDGALAFGDIRLKAPLARPVQMRDFLCFEEHLKNSFGRALDLAAAGAAYPAKAPILIAGIIRAILDFWLPVRSEACLGVLSAA